MAKRTFSAYERNHLLRSGFDPDTLTDEEMPVEYLTGKVTFYQLEFRVSPAVLIPRVETEELVELVIETCHQKTSENSLVIADVGTGSGAIGLSLATHLQAQAIPFHLYLSDISPEALHMAKANYQQLTPQIPVTFLESDLLTSYPNHLTFDVMIANLPYIPTSRLSQLDVSVRDFEPWLALDGGTQGVEIIHTFLSQAKPRLKPTGEIWLEVDETHTPELIDPQSEFEVTMFTDMLGNNRFARVRLR